MKESIIYFSIFWVIGFICLGIYLRFKFKDRFDEFND
tara:strand:- start:577 stop:687 length:111 start_codon:yes stop_codon:yes gene_type:complete